MSIAIPAFNAQGWEQDGSPATPRANGLGFAQTPGLGIGVATPGPRTLQGVPENAVTPSSPAEVKRSMQLSRPSGDDYFASAASGDVVAKVAPTTPAATEQPSTVAATTPATAAKDETPQSPVDGKKETGKGFGKKFRMGMSFGTKKLGRSASSSATEKPAVVEEKPEENKSESSSNHEKEVDDNLHGVIQKIQNEYEKQLQENPEKFVETGINPSLPIDTPVLRLPSGTKVILQEETSGGIANLYRGTVETVGVDVDIIKEKAPMWLGDVLLTVSWPRLVAVIVSQMLIRSHRTRSHPRIPSRSPLCFIHGRIRCLASPQLTATTVSMPIACSAFARSWLMWPSGSIRTMTKATPRRSGPRSTSSCTATSR